MYPTNWDGEWLDTSFRTRAFIILSSTDLRKAARHLENEIDLKLVSISKVGSGGTSATVPLLGEHVFDTLAVEIEQMLDKLSTINEKMAELPLSGTSSTHTLQRHRDILHVGGERDIVGKCTIAIQIDSISLSRVTNRSSTRSRRITRRDWKGKSCCEDPE